MVARPSEAAKRSACLDQRGLDLACEVTLGRVRASEVSRAPRRAERRR